MVVLAVCTPPRHHWHPMSHHKQFPILHCSKTPLFLHLNWNHPPNEPLCRCTLVLWESVPDTKNYRLSTLWLLPLRHLTPASSKWEQSWLLIPPWGHSERLLSLPVHWTSSSRIGPVPPPNESLSATTMKYTDVISEDIWSHFTFYENLHSVGSPSSLHTTKASLTSHESSQTVPHTPL